MLDGTSGCQVGPRWSDPSDMDITTRTHSLGEPQVAGPLAVFPVFGAPARLPYRAFVQAAGLGALVKEVEFGAVVGRLSVHNPTDLALLLYEGEEVLGAQQNRTFESSVLVAAGASLELSVSCVERGRWDGSRHGMPLRPSPQAADPDLRRLRRRRANLDGQADQHDVWRAVDSRLAHHRVVSPSSALSDLYDGRRDDLHKLCGAVRHEEGQIGALAWIAGRPAALDLVSCANVFATLLPALAQGYALHALDAPEGPLDRDAAEDFLCSVLRAPREPRDAPGIGQGFALGTEALVGAGLDHEGELIQLSAFPAEGAGLS